MPFHSWTPDVYEGAPTSVTAFMSAGAKAGAFAAFIRVAIVLLPLWHDSPAIYGGFADVLWLLAIVTMVVGNVIAVAQSNIKRMLAYSSIAHAGYILVGCWRLAQNAEGHAGVLFYVLAYTFMNLGAFGVLILLARRGDELVTMDDLQGLAQRQPWAAGLMAIFMLSLGGIPPTIGFTGKFFLFLGIVQAGQTAPIQLIQPGRHRPGRQRHRRLLLSARHRPDGLPAGEARIPGQRLELRPRRDRRRLGLRHRHPGLRRPLLRPVQHRHAGGRVAQPRRPSPRR